MSWREQCGLRMGWGWICVKSTTNYMTRILFTIDELYESMLER